MLVRLNGGGGRLADFGAHHGRIHPRHYSIVEFIGCTPTPELLARIGDQRQAPTSCGGNHGPLGVGGNPDLSCGHGPVSALNVVQAHRGHFRWMGSLFKPSQQVQNAAMQLVELLSLTGSRGTEEALVN